MKKIVLSTLAALSIATVASADALYQDANGQVYTKPAADRSEIKSTTLNSMTDKIDLSMLAYIGYVNTDYRDKTKADTNDFEARRMYFQVKAYLDGSKKDYFRLTYDVFNTGSVTTSGSASGGQYYAAQVKYAFLYLDKILPFTDIEIGQAHTTLLDYEEGHSWAYRSIDNVFTEQPNGPKLNASAGRGIDLKTNTQYFSSEIGLYNNTQYHDAENTYNNNGMGMDYEGRFTLHALGTGTDYKQDHTYWDVSLLAKHVAGGDKAGQTTGPENGYDATWFGVHSVFNTKQLLIAGQYLSSQDTDGADTVSKKAGTGYSVNFDARAGEKDQYHVFGRIDNWKQKMQLTSDENEQRTYIAGAAWDMNKNVQFVANVIIQDNQKDIANADTTNMNGKNGNSYMLTAQVQF